MYSIKRCFTSLPVEFCCLAYTLEMRMLVLVSWESGVHTLRNEQPKISSCITQRHWRSVFLPSSSKILCKSSCGIFFPVLHFGELESVSKRNDNGGDELKRDKSYMQLAFHRLLAKFFASIFSTPLPSFSITNIKQLYHDISKIYTIWSFCANIWVFEKTRHL